MKNPTQHKLYKCQYKRDYETNCSCSDWFKTEDEICNHMKVYHNYTGNNKQIEERLHAVGINIFENFNMYKY